MKYKIWSDKFKKYLDDGEWYINPSGTIYYMDMMDGDLIKAGEGYRILRFTELHDLNGQEIYEGDIVKLYYHHDSIASNQYEIKYGFGRWMLDDWECLSNLYLDNTKKYGDVCKVIKIGNVYERERGIK